jgi:carbonic anhydrase
MRSEAGDFVDNTAKESALKRLTVSSKLLGDLTGTGKLKVVAAIYDLETGVVTYIG